MRMTAPRPVDSAREVPVGGHAVSFYADPVEAREQSLSFLDGTPRGLTPKFWVADAATLDFYTAAAGDLSPDHVGCVALLETEHIAPEGGRLRPIGALRAFLEAHPEGVSAGADTISRYWSPGNVVDHLEYETWFAGQPRERSRFLCPYDLAAVPPALAPRVMRELGLAHTHVVLSESHEPGVRLLQLFVFGSARELPERLDASLGWAVRNELVGVQSGSTGLVLLPEGVEVVRAWAGRTSAPTAESGTHDGPPEPGARAAPVRGF